MRDRIKKIFSECPEERFAKYMFSLQRFSPENAKDYYRD
jgi:hypothetical protein